MIILNVGLKWKYFKNTVENIYKIEKRIETKDRLFRKIDNIRSKKKECRINDLPTVVQFTDEI